MSATQSFDRVEYKAGKRKARILKRRAPPYLVDIRTEVRRLEAEHTDHGATIKTF